MIVDGVTIDDEIYRTETFGPIIGVATFSDFDEAMHLANDHGYGLSSSIYTTDALNAFRFRERITAGMISVNNSTSGRGGAPALRRQRQVGQRLAAVGHLGTGPVHPLAVHELGLRGEAAEGADGQHHRIHGRQGVPAMSGLIGKAMKFAKSPQGKKALDKAQKYVKSEEGKEKIEDLKDKVGGHKEKDPKAAAKAAPVAGTPAPSAEPVDTTTEPKPDPNAPTA